MIYTVENTILIGVRVKVLLDGKPVKNCFYADDEKGVVKFYDDPPKIHKSGKRAISRTARGSVEVVTVEKNH